MKKIIIVTILLLVTLAMLNASAVALLSAAKGNVELRRAAKTVKYKTGDMLQNNDELRTGGESFAAYKYIDGATTIKVFANSYVQISAQKSGSTMSKNAKVSTGSIYAKVTANKGTMTVQTPTSVASVKGTGFLTKVSDFGESKFVVMEGVVDVTVPDTKETKAVNAGFTAEVDRDGNLEVRESTEDDLTELERAEIESTRVTEPQSIRIPVADKNGNIRYIDINW
jgi:hypothetical protein